MEKYKVLNRDFFQKYIRFYRKLKGQTFIEGSVKLSVSVRAF